MKYFEAAPIIKQGDLLFFTHTEWDSWYDLQVQAVRIAGETEITHVAIAYPMDGELWILESVVPKVRAVPLTNVLNETGFWWVSLDTLMTPTEVVWARHQIARAEYSKVQGVQAQFGVDVTNDDGLMECAKYAIMCRELSGVNLGTKATPAAVMREAQKLPNSKTVFVEP